MLLVWAKQYSLSDSDSDLFKPDSRHGDCLSAHVTKLKLKKNGILRFGAKIKNYVTVLWNVQFYVFWHFYVRFTLKLVILQVLEYIPVLGQK